MKPLCDTCGTRHEKYQGHVFASNFHQVLPVPPQPRTTVTVANGIPVANKVANRYRDLEKRKNYMKEYMRKRRLKV